MPKLKEGAYIALARRALVAKTFKETAGADEIAAKRACASAMHSVSVQSFDFVVDGVTYSANLERPSATRISVRKLYTMLANNEIGLDEFLDCISASVRNVSEVIGHSRALSLTETYKKGLDLVITEK